MVKRGKAIIDDAKAPRFGQFDVFQYTFEIEPTIICGYKGRKNVSTFQ